MSSSNPTTRLELETVFGPVIKAVTTTTGITWGGVVKNEEGELIPLIYKQRPCYGEMRRYADGTRPDDPHPDDLPRPIPFGERMAFVVRLFDMGEDHEEIIKLMFSKTGPWRRGLGGDVEFVRNGHNKLVGVRMVDTDVDPTVLANLLVTHRNISNNPAPITLAESRAAGLTDMQALFARIFCIHPSGWYNGSYATHYYLNPRLDLKRWAQGDTLDLSNERTWREQEDYNRPELANVFGFESTLDINVHVGRNGAPADEYRVEHIIEKVKNLGIEHGF